MLLQKKIITIVSRYLKVLAVHSDHKIIFGYKETVWEIKQISLFIYEIKVNEEVIFVGNYYQLEGFIKGLQKYYKSHELVLRDPTVLNTQLVGIITDDEPKKLKKEISTLNEKIVELTTKSEKVDVYKKELLKINKAAQERNDKILKQELEIKQLKEDCEEAANLISTLYYNKEDIEYGIKHYKLDHFPKDVQEFILDIIKEYYNK